MKTNPKKVVLTSLCMLICMLVSNAQNHSRTFTSASEGLPANRAAFIFCYNSSSYKNPAEVVLNTKQATKQKIENKTTKAVNVRMFPNTTEDELWVQVDKNTYTSEDLNLEIYNDSGEIIYNSKVEENLHKVNVCDFSAGTFLIRLGDNVQKLVIE